MMRIVHGASCSKTSCINAPCADLSVRRYASSLALESRSTLESDAPTRAAGKCTSPGCCSSNGRRLSPSGRGKSASGLRDRRSPRVLPGTTQARACSTLGYFRNHCSLRRGSIGTSPPLAESDVVDVRFGSFESSRRLKEFRSLFTRSEPVEAGKVGPGFRCHVGVRGQTSMSGRLCRRPISKSALSCAGVTLSTPVPNVKSTCSSAMIGMSRWSRGWSSGSARMTCLPMRCW